MIAYKEVYEYVIFGERHLVMKTIHFDDFENKNWYAVDIFDERYDNVVNLEYTSKLSEAKKVYNYWKKKFAKYTKMEMPIEVPCK